MPDSTAVAAVVAVTHDAVRQQWNRDQATGDRTAHQQHAALARAAVPAALSAWLRVTQPLLAHALAQLPAGLHPAVAATNLTAQLLAAAGVEGVDRWTCDGPGCTAAALAPYAGPIPGVPGWTVVDDAAGVSRYCSPTCLTTGLPVRTPLIPAGLA